MYCRNKQMIKLFLIIVIVLSVVMVKIESSFAENNIGIDGIYSIVMDRKTKEIIYSKNENEKMYPASTTKVWTAYLTLKYSKGLDEKITVSKDLSYVEPSSMYLKEGESFTIKQLLQSLMLNSSNDVAVLLAEHISGTVEEFAKLMNEEAKKIGCKNTNFVNPNGLPDENHYSTAYDMGLIGIEAMKNEKLAEIVKTEVVTIPKTKQTDYNRIYRNTNKFISGKGTIQYNNQDINPKYDIVDGLKTGYTRAAGRCLLTTATKDGMDVIVGVFKSNGDNVYSDSRRLIDYAYENYKTINILSKSNFNFSKKMFLTKPKVLTGYIKEDYNLTVEKKSEAESLYNTKIVIKDKLKFPIKKDSIIGSVEIYDEEMLIDTVDIYSNEEIDNIISLFMKHKNKIFTILIILIVIKVKQIYRKRQKIKRKIKIKKIENRKKDKNLFNR